MQNQYSILRKFLLTSMLLFFNSSMILAEEKPAIKKQSITVNKRIAFVILPTKQQIKPIPWVFYAPTLTNRYPSGAEQWMFRQFLAKGIAIAGIDVGESYGSPKGRAAYNSLHQKLTTKYGFAKKACLLARSRGGLMLYCWAAENPEKVKCIAGIYPVCNIASYPGLKLASGAYGMTQAELTTKLKQHNPIDRLAPLAKASVPIFHIHGDIDNVVPLKLNSALVKKRYDALGGKMELNIIKGQGHNMWKGFFQCQKLVDFTIRHATTSEKKNLPTKKK